MNTIRETVAIALNDSSILRDLGLPENATFQADTADSPEMRPFIVIRWGDEIQRMGPAYVRELTLWFYDEFGDYTRCESIAKAAPKYLANALVQVPCTDGYISQILYIGDGMGQGGDMADDTFNALVIPWTLRAVCRDA
jgi:hypothetical protein